MIELKNCMAAYWATHYVDSEFAKVASSPFLIHLRDTLNHSTQDKTKVKFSYFSLRPEVIYQIAQSIGITNSTCIMSDLLQKKNTEGCFKPVDQSMNLIWELHQDDSDSSKWFVRTMLNRDPVDFCQVFKSPNFDCSIQAFVKRINKISNPEYDAWCNPKQNAKPDTHSKFWMIFTFMIMFLNIAIFGISYFGFNAVGSRRTSTVFLPDRDNTISFNENAL